MEFRSATSFSGGHSDDVDYVSWNPIHPELFCTSSQKDRRIVFWDARRVCGIYCVRMHAYPTTESRYIQQCSLKVSPVQTCYSPDGRSLLYTSAGNQLFYMTLSKDVEDTKEQWRLSEREPVRIQIQPCKMSNGSDPGSWLSRCFQPCWRWYSASAQFRTRCPCHGLP